MLAFTLVPVALFAAEASASAIVTRNHLLSLLQVRQDGGFDPNDIPPQCQIQCATAAQVLGSTSCQDASCLCTEQVNTGFQQCLGCLLGLATDDPALSAQSQSSLENYEDVCKQAGVPLTSLTITASAPGGSATATRSGASSVSIPSVTATRSGSVFFSSASSNGAPTSVASDSGGALTTNGPPATRSVITAISSSDDPTGTAEPTGGDGNNNAQGVGSGAGSVIASLSTVVLTGLTGIVMLLAL